MMMSTDKKYQIIYADPPWQYQDRGCNGNAENHYNTMTLQALKDLPVKDMADKNCTLFLWTTYPMLRESMEVITAWGFKYKTIAFQWVKLNKSGRGYFFGLGRWTRGNTECCLLAVKGKPQRQANNVSQLIFSPISKHSAKPDSTRDKIVQLMGSLPRIELFARQRYPGWDSWGNEVPEEMQLKIG